MRPRSREPFDATLTYAVRASALNLRSGAARALAQLTEYLAQLVAVVPRNHVTGLVADLVEVVAHVFDSEVGVDVALCEADEEAGDDTASRRVHLAGDRTVFVAQPYDDRRHELWLELRTEIAHQRFGHAGEGNRSNGVDLDVVLGPFNGEHPREADEAHLRGAVVCLAEVAE